jgi:hypothetical protein
MEEWFARMDEVRAGEDVTVEVQAFAEDQLVLISASSLAKLEAAWDKTWAACQLWAEEERRDSAQNPQGTDADRKGGIGSETVVVFRPKQRNRRSRQDGEEG